MGFWHNRNSFEENAFLEHNHIPRQETHTGRNTPARNYQHTQYLTALSDDDRHLDKPQTDIIDQLGIVSTIVFTVQIRHCCT